ncbi:MAG: HAD family phosphatase [Gammaproteobacteria bacterium]|nr:HAD family phosphatase [Gammaproteobacteria bacterium]
MDFKGAIFDFDGVVVDTTPLHYRSWEKLLIETHSQPFDDIVYESVVNGRRSKDVITELLPHLNESQQQQALEFKQKHYLELISQGELKIFHSTINLIYELAKNNIKLAVASSSRSVHHILEQADIHNLFHTVISGNDTSQGKPHPESFLLAANGLKLNPENCVVFEDAKAGVEAAKSGGFLCIGIDRKNKPEHFSKADLKVTDLKEINHHSLAGLFKQRY